MRAGIFPEIAEGVATGSCQKKTTPPRRHHLLADNQRAFCFFHKRCFTLRLM
jgi:hypothetical protein